MTEVEHLWIMKTALILPSKHTKSSKLTEALFRTSLGNFKAEIPNHHKPTNTGREPLTTTLYFKHKLTNLLTKLAVDSNQHVKHMYSA